MNNHSIKTGLAGVIAAAVTPLNSDQSLDLDGLVNLLSFLAGRGCHGALLLGTTGEGPSFSTTEREKVLKAAQGVRQQYPAFHLLAGTGTPSLEETITLTKSAYDLGYDGVVVLPPYYLRKVTDEGLFGWFSQVLQQAVPEGGNFLGYHIPPISGVSLSLDLLARLKDKFPSRFAGIKDSSADPQHARALDERFGRDLTIFNGTDRLFSQALQWNAAGCITALANVISDDLRLIWEAHLAGKTDPSAQASANTARDVSEAFLPAPALLKMLLNQLHGFPAWAVKYPLLPLSEEVEQRALLAWKTRGKIA